MQTVPIHTFEDKVVALYFYHPDRPNSLIEELKLAYEELAKIKKIFEVVLFYIYEPRQRHHWVSEENFWKSEESFWEKFKTMPWLALPFKDMSYKKLMRVFEFQSADALVPSLVIFGPRADYIDPFGFRMLRKYGIGGFPFTRKKSAELENEKIKELKLGMLWDPNTVFRRNDGSQVSLSQLSGKRVMLVLETFDVSRVVGDGSTEVKSITEFLTMLKERYLQKKGSDDEFEVIRILVSNTESSVNKHLVGDLPWLVSPGSKLMHELHSSFFWYGQSTCDLLKDHIPIFAFNPDGKLVRKTMYPTFEVSEFPFYAGSLEEETLSQLNTYWGYDYLEDEYFRYNGEMQTVPIHTFEDKVVALYFYHPDRPNSLIEELKLAYEELAKIKKIFEVVLFYIYEPRQRHHWVSEENFWKSEESFWEKFKTMPWLALPFKDMSYKKLMRVFEFQSADALVPSLVIFGPRADYIDPFGFRMLRKYGIGGFPFTRKKSAELENEKIKELKLGMLWDPNTVFRRNDGSQVSLSQLSGKRVMLVLETFDVSRVVGDGSTEVKSITEFLTMLKERYLQKKGSDDEFEVIRILVSNTESFVNKHLVGDLPWLVSPGSKLMHELHSSFFWYGQSTCDLLKDDIPIFAFNPDGKLVRKTMYPTFEVSEFPFYAGSLEEETLSQLNTYWGYDYLENEYFRYNGVPIHTFEDKVVALYFYHPDRPNSLIEELKLAYEELAKIKKIFEVVLFYIYEPRQRHHWVSEENFWKSEESFWEKFKTMPWLALPFKDMSYKKLMRVFEFQSADALVPSLVIFGPRADYIDPFGFRMLRKYGIGGFPFTRKKSAELENEKIKELKLGMLWDPNTVFRRNDGSQVSLSQLSGKRVMLVLETFDVSRVVGDGSTEVKSITEFLTMLKERYLQKKGSDDEFEVIRILVSNTESSVNKHLVGDLPWLVSPGSKLMHELHSSFFWYGQSTCDLLKDHIPIFAFNPDGNLSEKQCILHLRFRSSPFMLVV
ncbi:hypothetical protein OROMI_023721 [Orobanche minor]